MTLKQNNTYRFPDSITKRGQKHLQFLIRLAKTDHQAVILFLIQRNDAEKFEPANQIDLTYGKLLRKANKNGGKLLPFKQK